MNLKKLGIKDLEYLAKYFSKNKDKFQTVINDFGTVEKDNGYGTFFLNPINTLFKVFWINIQGHQIMSVGFGGPNLGLSLQELYENYSNYNKGYSRHDGEYIYVLFKNTESFFSLKIRSKIELFNNGDIIKNIPINEIEIILE